MALDPSIAMGYKGIELANPLVQYGQIAQIQNAQNQNALAQYQLSAAQRSDEQQNALYAAAKRPDFKLDFQSAIQYGAPGIAAYKAQQEAAGTALTQTKTQGEIDAQKVKAAMERVDAFSTALAPLVSSLQANKPITHNDVFAQANRLVSQGLLRKEDLAAIPMNVAELPKFVMGMASSTENSRKALETYLPQALVAGGNVINKNAMAFGGIGNVIAPVSMTGFETARLPILQQTANASTTSANAAAANANTARQRLEQETATGQLTPQTLDFAAETYRQTGQMPISGMGKNAAALRTQILNRATELAGGMPAAEAAATVASNKQDIGSRTKAVKDFSTGKQGQQVNAFNTAIDHLGTMSKLTDALQNNDIKAFNTLGNTVARQTGQPAPTDFNAAKQIVTAEIIKAVVASGGGVTERQEAERNFADANSPQQLKGIINTYKQLLGGQLNSLSLQYENTTGRKDFNTKLTPEAKNTVAKLRGENITTGALAPADQEAMNWANANPTDPRAAQIKQKLGR